MRFIDYFDKKNVLITGSNGFLGRNLVELLKESKASIAGIGRQRESSNKDIRYYSCDLREYSHLQRILAEEEPDIIYNFAALNNTARDPALFQEMIDIHLQVLYHLYLYLKDKTGFKLLVNLGSTEEYGDYGGRPFQEDFFEKSFSPYAASKTAATHFAFFIARNEGFPVITIRPGVIFGPYQAEERFIPYVIKHLLADEELLLTPGEQKRDFIPVKLFLEIMQKLITSEGYKYGEIYNIASGISISLKEVVLFLKAVLKSNSKLSFGALPYRKNEIMDFRISVEKIKTLVDYTSSLDDIKRELIKMAGVITGG